MSKNMLKLVHFEPGLPKRDSALVAAKITIEVETQLSRVEFVWRAFENFAAGHVFQTFDWVSIWYSTIGRHAGISPQIVVGRGPGGAVLFLLPLGISRRHGLTMLEWLGGTQADIKAGLFASDFLRQVRETDWTRLWGKICDRLPQFDLMHLTDQPDVLDGVPQPFGTLRTHRQADHIRGTRLLGDWKSYCDSKRPPVWNVHDSKRGQLDNLGELQFEVASDPGRVTELLQKLFAGKAKLLRRNREANPFAASAMRTFYWRQAQRTYPYGPVHLSALTLNGKPIAINWGMSFKGRFYSLLSAYDLKLSHASPKTRLYSELVRWCLEHGLEHFAFGVDEQGSRYGWCDEQMRLFSTIRGRSPKGRIAALAFGLKARLDRRARTSKLWRRIAGEFRDLVRPPVRVRHEL